jgi:hypothetical protein
MVQKMQKGAARRFAFCVYRGFAGFFGGKKRARLSAPGVGMPFDAYLRSTLLVKRNPHSFVFDRSCSIIFYNGSILLLL